MPRDETPPTTPRHILKYTWWALLAFTAVVGAVIATIDEGLRTPAAPLGIVSFELCAYAHACADILRAWDAQATQLAMLSLGVDYLFMLLYPATIFVGLWLTLPWLRPNLQTLTRWGAWSSWSMGFLALGNGRHLVGFDG